ncbi:MAG: A/G-specific adenine glycosylase [Gammaproteobacteria bacterium]|jgi:A/G-specific adenine glycosylase
MPKTHLHFSNKLIPWYLENKREMPWRQTTNPYFIWLSEIILQQTRVAQGLPYYLIFTETFPTLQDLAEAPEEQVLKLWQGLGYYSRARNLHAASKYVAIDCNGNFPNTYDSILKMKGVGDYTASAIASICFNEPTAVVDGNVYRVLSRVFGIDTPMNSTLGIKEFKALSQELIDPEQAATYNQAVMEFGAIQCKPQNPDCSICVFNDQCAALATNSIDKLPVKINKTKVRHRNLHFLVFRSPDHKTMLRQRTGKGIWQGLYEFPFIELEMTQEQPFISEGNCFREPIFPEGTSATKHPELSPYTCTEIVRHNTIPIIHKLSHQHLHTTFWIIDVPELPENAIPVTDLKDFAVPVLISNFINTFTVN